jgi:hypothetical protein
MTHSPLRALANDTLREELADSLPVCHGMCPSELIGFAYPYGDLDDRVYGEVRASGCAWACTTRSNFVDCRKFYLLALSRLAVGDWQPQTVCGISLKRRKSGHLIKNVRLYHREYDLKLIGPTPKARKGVSN